MRVITGTARGANLKTLSGLDTRPTIERVKEAIFSSLFNELTGKRVLDLFAGSGQMGIEALSRGAAHAVFIDASRNAADIVRQNLLATHLTDKAEVKVCDSLAYLKTLRENSFDLVFIDPPYGKGLVNASLELLSKTRALSDNAVVICESDEPDEVFSEFGKITLQKTAKYGRVVIRYFRNGLGE